MSLSENPQTMLRMIRKLDNAPNIPRASYKVVHVIGTIELMVNIGRSMKLVTLLVAKRLATYVLLRCDFCDLHGDSIKLLLAIVEMDDG